MIFIDFESTRFIQFVEFLTLVGSEELRLMLLHCAFILKTLETGKNYMS